MGYGVDARTAQEEEPGRLERESRLTESEGSSQTSDLDYSFQCTFCEGSGVLYPEIGHNIACSNAGECIGRPFCPVRYWIQCDFCEGGSVNFDYTIFRVAIKITVEPGYGKEMKSTWPGLRKKIRQQINECRPPEFETIFSLETSKNKDEFIFSVTAWSIEQAIEKIESILHQCGFPLYRAINREVFHVRQIHGIYASKSGRKILYGDERLEQSHNVFKNQIRKSHALLGSTTE